MRCVAECYGDTHRSLWSRHGVWNRSPAAVGRSLDAAERSSLDAKTRCSQLTISAVRSSCSPSSVSTLHARSRVFRCRFGASVGRVAERCFLPMVRPDRTYSSHLHGPSRVQALLEVKKSRGFPHLDYVLLADSVAPRLLHDDAVAHPLCGRVAPGRRLSAPLPRYALFQDSPVACAASDAPPPRTMTSLRPRLSDDALSRVLRRLFWTTPPIFRSPCRVAASAGLPQRFRQPPPPLGSAPFPPAVW